MKYMTFNSSCSYAGVANMLEQYGMDTDDRTIALNMKLPFLFAYEDGVYLAGPMLQSAKWFNVYLNPIGFQMTEREVPAGQVPQFLKQQKTAMLGLQTDRGTHAVVYVGAQDDKLIFLNNKWEQESAPEQIVLTSTELFGKLGEAVMIATLDRIKPREGILTDQFKTSVEVLRQNLAEIGQVCGREETVGNLRAKLNTLFRPLLLDGITMLNLLGETELARGFTEIQRDFLNALRQDVRMPIILGEYICVDELTRLTHRYVALIEASC